MSQLLTMDASVFSILFAACRIQFAFARRSTAKKLDSHPGSGVCRQRSVSQPMTFCARRVMFLGRSPRAGDATVPAFSGNRWDVGPVFGFGTAAGCGR